MRESKITFLEELERIIESRINEGNRDSYTVQLAESGTARMAQKVGEEAVELVLAAASGDRNAQLDETADLLYHLLVLLNDKAISLADVADVLEQRHR